MAQANPSTLHLMDEVQTTRFWSLTRPTPTGCIEWVGSTDQRGYGLFQTHWKHPRRMAHRVAWELHRNTPIPVGLVVDHLCRNTSCVNPAHLDAVTQRVNVLRGESVCAERTNRVEQGRCHRGHDLTAADSWWVSPDGSARLCRACMREKRHERYLRDKERLGIPDRNLGRVCDVDGCSDKYWARGKCRRHYDAEYRARRRVA
jgi:hypothetical protein